MGRRSATHNAELKHVIDKGSLHLFIVAIKSIDKNQEILLPPEGTGEVTSPLPSINADLKEIKKPVNGLLSGLSSPEEAPLKDSIKSKKERKKVKVVLKAAKNENRRATGVRGRNKIKTEKVTTTEVKKETPPTPKIKTPPPPKKKTKKKKKKKKKKK